MDHEIVILDRVGGLVHQLNPTASYIWNEWDGIQSTTEIAASLAERFNAVPDTVLHDVLAALAQFEQVGLLVPDDQNGQGGATDRKNTHE